MLLALDARGDVIWYYNSDFRTAGIARLSNGNILMHRTDFSTVEIDLLGNVVRQFYAEERPYAPPEKSRCHSHSRAADAASPAP